jgi:hypothetical protein
MYGNIRCNTLEARVAFVDLHRYLDLNRDKAEEMGQAVADSAQPALNQAGAAVGQLGANAYDPARAAAAFNAVTQAQRRLGAATSSGGQANVLGQKYGYSGAAKGADGSTNLTGMGMLDAYLSGNSQAVQRLQGQSAALGQQLGAAQAQSQKRLEDQQQRQQAMTAQQQAQRDAQAQSERDRQLQGDYQAQQQWRFKNYAPNPGEYAAYSDYVQGKKRY